MVTAATTAANTRADELDTKEDEQLKAAFGIEEGSRVKGPSKLKVEAAKKQLLKHQKSRRKRMIRDEADRSLVDLLGLFRDVLMVQVGSNLELINQEMRPAVESFAARGNPADTTRTLVAIEQARASIKASTPPQLAVEAVMVSIKDPKLASVHVNMQ